MLVLASALLVGLNRIAGQRISGTAKADWPQPPGVGSCVDLLSGVGGVVVVPCGGPHDAEATKSYSALDPVLADSPTASLDAACSDAGRGYLGHEASGATFPGGADGGWGWDGTNGAGVADDAVMPLGLNYSTFPVGAPQSERAGDRGWAVCVIQPKLAVRYLGSIHGATLTDAPDAFRTCWGRGGGNDPVTCAGPHAFEVFGAARGGVSIRLTVSPPTRADAGAALGADAETPDGGGALATPEQQQRVWQQVQAQTDSMALAQALAEDMERALAAGQPADSAVTGQVDSDVIALAKQLVTRHQQRTEQCRAMIADALGVADPTYGGVLTVEVRAGIPAGPAPPSTRRPGRR
ncbi:MAG: hypothetical protein BGO26_12670 [Actinobacteria bacterium 69-20]|nr:hypothetical protein [Actinomycetota bacterium]OJV23545.1 MAG: hypothetical protein BGO26_12670 [Actinobacteria bacterium 69-20]